MQKQILELKSQGKTARSIAKLLKVSRNTVRAVLERGEALDPSHVQPEWSKQIDWNKVHLEISRGVQINILAREHALGIISYVQFWREYRRRYPQVPSVTMRLIHKPGEKCFFDYGDGIDIIINKRIM